MSTSPPTITSEHPGLADGLYAGALELDAQRQALEDIFKLACDFRFSFAPTTGGRQRPNLVTHIRICEADHHGELVSALLGQFLVSRFL